MFPSTDDLAIVAFHSLASAASICSGNRTPSQQLLSHWLAVVATDSGHDQAKVCRSGVENGYLGMMEKKMETTIWSSGFFFGSWVLLFLV